MKALKIIGIVLVVLIGLYLTAAVVAPTSMLVEKSVVVNTPASSVYQHVICFKNWESWNPWDAMDPTNTNSYSGEECGVGAIYSWEGKQTGSGTQEMVEVRENEYIKATLMFTGVEEPQVSEWFFEETEEGTKVTWNYIGSEVSFFNRPANLMGEYFLGMAYENGLATLKEVAESSPAPVEEESYDIQTIELPASHYLLVSAEISPEEIALHYGENFPKIMGYLEEKGAEMNGHPTGLYFSWTDTLTKMAAAIPVNMEVEGNDEIEGRLIGGGQALQIDYYGPYDGVGPAHYALEDYSNENGVNLEGFAMEVYVTDPMEEADTSKWLTKIIYPIAAE